MKQILFILLIFSITPTFADEELSTEQLVQKHSFKDSAQNIINQNVYQKNASVTFEDYSKMVKSGAVKPLSFQEYLRMVRAGKLQPMEAPDWTSSIYVRLTAGVSDGVCQLMYDLGIKRTPYNSNGIKISQTDRKSISFKVGEFFGNYVIIGIILFFIWRHIKTSKWIESLIE